MLTEELALVVEIAGWLLAKRDHSRRAEDVARRALDREECIHEAVELLEDAARLYPELADENGLSRLMEK